MAEKPILHKLVLGFMGNNIYIYGPNKKEMAIIDAGFEEKSIKEYLTKHKLIPKVIIITHGHRDHTAVAPSLARYYHIPIIISSKTGRFRADKIKKVENGDEISLGKLQLVIKHAPGHSKDSIIVIDYENKLIFVGDVLFKSGVGRTDFMGGSHQLLMDSIKKVIIEDLSISDDFLILPGHGPETTVGDEKKFNPFRSYW